MDGLDYRVLLRSLVRPSGDEPIFGNGFDKRLRAVGLEHLGFAGREWLGAGGEPFLAVDPIEALERTRAGPGIARPFVLSFFLAPGLG